jgi:hypothetical protein
VSNKIPNVRFKVVGLLPADLRGEVLRGADAGRGVVVLVAETQQNEQL